MRDESASQLARALAERRKQVQNTCAACGQPFVGLRTRKYCSTRCTQAAYRARHREKLAAWQREHYQHRKATTGSGKPLAKGAHLS